MDEQVRTTATGASATLTVYPGEVVTAAVTTGNDFVRLDSFEWPTVRVALEVVDSLTFPANSPPSAPEWSGSAFTGPYRHHYDLEDGYETTDLRLFAQTDCYGGWQVECTMEHRFFNGVEEVILPGAPDHVMSNSGPAVFAPPGWWLVSARSLWSGVVDGTPVEHASPWVARGNGIIMMPLDYDEPSVAPGEPTRPSADTCDDEARLTAWAWDVDGQDLRVLFEVVPADLEFDGNHGQTEHLWTGFESYPVEPPPHVRQRFQATFHPPTSGPYKARVIGLDSAGNLSPWSEETTFVVGEMDSCRAESALVRLQEGAGRYWDRPDWYEGLGLDLSNLVDVGDVDPCPDCGLAVLPAVLQGSMTGVQAEPLLSGLVADATTEALLASGRFDDLFAGSAPLAFGAMPADLENLEAAVGAGRTIVAELHDSYTSPTTGFTLAQVTLVLLDAETGAELFATADGSGADEDGAWAEAAAAAVPGLLEKLD